MVLLSGCVKTVYIEPVKPDCAESIVTNGDLVECLIRYQEM